MTYGVTTKEPLIAEDLEAALVDLRVRYVSDLSRAVGLLEGLGYGDDYLCGRLDDLLDVTKLVDSGGQGA